MTELARVACLKKIELQVVYTHTSLTLKIILKDFWKKGDSQLTETTLPSY